MQGRGKGAGGQTRDSPSHFALVLFPDSVDAVAEENLLLCSCCRCYKRIPSLPPSATGTTTIHPRSLRRSPPPGFEEL